MSQVQFQAKPVQFGRLLEDKKADQYRKIVRDTFGDEAGDRFDPKLCNVEKNYGSVGRFFARPGQVLTGVKLGLNIFKGFFKSRGQKPQDQYIWIKTKSPEKAQEVLEKKIGKKANNKNVEIKVVGSDVITRIIMGPPNPANKPEPSAEA